MQILHYVRACGLAAGKIKTFAAFKPGQGYLADPYQFTGLPDIIAFDDDKKIMYAIEAKVNGNTQSENQKAFQQLFHAPPGRIYLVIYSLEEIQKIIS